ncbi:MAG: DMT family transporter [Alphaproteobacteria bacterium]|nr:DMT family transporter [Alphaproteobacteria bacterium]
MTPRMPATLVGVLLASSATAIGGGTVVFTRLIVDDTDSLTLATVRYGIAALFLFAILLATTRLPRIELRDKIWLVVFGILMFSGFPYFLTRALEDTTAARGALLFATIPLITIAIGAIFRIERITWTKLSGIAIAIGAAVLALGENVDVAAPNALRGDAFMAVAMLCASIFYVFSPRYLVRYGNLPVMVYTMLVGTGFLLVLTLLLAPPLSQSLAFDLEGWIIVLGLAIPGAALMNFMWGRALQLITPTQATITVGINPITALLLGAWILSEPVTLRVMVATAMLIVAIFLTTRGPRERPGSGAEKTADHPGER